MPLILFSFCFETTTKEAAVGGNIDPQVALQVLQQIVVASLVEKARGDGAKPSTAAPSEQGGQVKGQGVENAT
jgi:hypothetical protein